MKMTDFKILRKEEFERIIEKPNQKDVWDSIADPWKAYRVNKISIVKEFLKDKKGKVIDLGCGNGRNMIYNKKIKYYGVDFSSKQIENAINNAKENHIDAEFFVRNADNLSLFKDNMFDYGLFIASLHCIETDDERLNALKEFYRALKDNGEGLISVWNSDDKRFDCVNHHGQIYMSWIENNNLFMRNYYLYYKDELKDLIKSVGFKIIKFYEPRDKDRFSKKNWIVKVRK